MKRLCILIFFIIPFIFSCEREKVEPIDIFQTEELSDPTGIDLGSDTGLDKLMVNSDRIIETSTGYHIKGTIFCESYTGIIPVTSGDFTIKNGTNSLKGLSGGFDFSGYGTAGFPSAGLFSVSEIDQIPGSEVYYNTGKIFKSESKNEYLPLDDNRYYFRYRLDKAGSGKEYKMKNITVKLREFYIDARDPAATFTGDIYSRQASGVNKLIVEQGVAGISANELWNFEPYTFSKNLEKVTGGTGFERMNGGIFLSGIIPVKKYPVKILGQAVINTSFSKNGSLDFFERGFDDASFRIGVNGRLFFSNELVSFLTGTDTVSLGKATLQADFSDESFNIRMAGEYSNNVIDRFLGGEMMKYIPFNAGKGIMYLRGSEDPDQFIVYMEEQLSLQIPGLGETALKGSILRITKDEAGLTGTINLPYNIGDVDVTGVLHSDGSFLLKGKVTSNVDLGSGLVYNANLDCELTEKGVKLSGRMNLPYGVGDLEISGGILSDELFFNGAIKSAIPFPVNTSVNSDLQVAISTKSGINLIGELGLPAGIGNVKVAGTLNATELLLKGTIGTGTRINFGDVDVTSGSSISLTASSNTGVIMTGSVSLPFSLGDAAATLRVITGGLAMTGDLGSHINISGYPVFAADISAIASSSGGLYLSGEMKFPGKFGWVDVSGRVRNSGYYLTGDISSATIDFGIVKLSTDFSMNITNYSGIQTKAKGEGCISLVVDKLCESVGVDVNIDYYSNAVKLCMDFPVAGNACIGW